MAQMNWLAVIVSALVGFLVVYLWYGPLFGRTWRRVAGVHDSNVNLPSAEKLYGMALIYSFISAIFVGHLLANFPGRPFHVYLMITGGIGLGFVFPVLGMRSLLTRKSGRMLALDTIGWTLFFLSMGVVFSLLG
jgi:hypothetical protein